MCGATNQVPMMSEIRALPPAASADSQQSSTWGLPQGLSLFGAVILLAASCVAGYFYWQRPRAPTTAVVAEAVQVNIEGMSLLESVQYFRERLQPGLDPEKTPPEKAYERVVAQYWSWMGILAALGSAGAALVVVGLRMARRQVARVKADEGG
jgi:hypothetical protein